MTAFPPHPKPPPSTPPPLGHAVPKDRWPAEAELVRLHEAMLRSRRIEERTVELYRQNRITGGCYTGVGNEATSVGSAWALGEDDVLVPTHRDMGSHLVRGHTPLDIMRQYLKRKTAQTEGKDSSLHLGAEGTNIVGMISPLAHMMAVAAGVALAERQKGKTACVLTSVGDGSTSLGEFHEALNFAAVQKLPVLFTIVNNQYAYSTPVTIQYACAKLSDRAIGYGMPGATIDGTDVIEVLDASRTAFALAREGGGPTLLECVTMRMRGHSEHDDMKYVPKPLFEAWKAWDPIVRLEEVLGLDEARRRQVRARVDEEIDRAIEVAEKEPAPEGPEAETGVYRLWDDAWTVPAGGRR